MKKGNKKTKSIKPKAEKEYPVPEWMDPKVAETAKGLDITERLAVADQLEKDAAQLRGFNPAKVKHEAVATYVTPMTKECILEYYEAHCGEKERESEADKLACGARWILEIAVMMLPEIAARGDAFVHYRDAEGIDNGHLVESWAARSLAAYKTGRRCNDHDDDDDKAEG
jgi:hypothetical protein